MYREGFKWTFFGKILWWPYEYVTGEQARIDREREDAIQKEIDDIAAEKAAREARLEILKRGGKTKKPKKGNHAGGTRAETGRDRGAAAQATRGGGGDASGT